MSQSSKPSRKRNAERNAPSFDKWKGLIQSMTSICKSSVQISFPHQHTRYHLAIVIFIINISLCSNIPCVFWKLVLNSHRWSQYQHSPDPCEYKKASTVKYKFTSLVSFSMKHTFLKSIQELTTHYMLVLLPLVMMWPASRRWYCQSSN